MSFSRREEEREAEVAAAGGASSLGKVGIGGTLFFAHHIVKCVFSFRLIFCRSRKPALTVMTILHSPF